MIRDSLDRLRQLAPGLNAASDAMNAQVRLIEGHLKRLNLGVAARCAIVTNELPPGATAYLSYCRVETKDSPWGLEISTGDGEAWPFCQAPRTLRFLAISAIPDLLEALIPMTEALTKRLEISTAMAEDIERAIAPAPEEPKL